MASLPTTDNNDDELAPLRAHAIFSVAQELHQLLGVEKDLVQLMVYLSLAAGRMAMPVHLDIQSDELPIDLHLANRILDLCPQRSRRVDTHREFRTLEKMCSVQSVTTESSNDPDSQRLAAILIRGCHHRLSREASEYVARTQPGHCAMPSLLRISDVNSGMAMMSTTLRIQASQVDRGLEEFGESFSGYRSSKSEKNLAELIDSLPPQPQVRTPFRAEYRGKAQPALMLIFERLLTVAATLRIALPQSVDVRSEITIDDYSAVRALLRSLPLMPLNRRLTPQAIRTGEVIYRIAQQLKDQLDELPDRSNSGKCWFTRQQAIDWTGDSYNTVKKHFRELEEEGILISNVAESNRDRGRQLHFRFREGRGPPFLWRNPFEGLPDPTEFQINSIS